MKGHQEGIEKVCSILVVEDSESARNLILDVLATEGHRVHGVEDFSAARGWLADHEPDLLLLDYRLPDMTARDFIEGYGNLLSPFIVMTGHGDEKIAVEMMKLGALDYLAKDEGFYDLLPTVIDKAVASLQRERQLQASRQALEYRERFEQLISTISSRFLRLPPYQVDAGIDRALCGLGRFIGIDRCYLYRFVGEPLQMNVTNEWCADGIKSLKDMRQGVRAEDIPWVVSESRTRGGVNVPRIDGLPAEASREKSRWQALGICSILGVTLAAGDRVLGSLCFEMERTEKVWDDRDIALIRTVAEILASTLERQSTDIQLRESEARYRAVVEDQTELICRYLADGRLTFVNRAFCRFFGREQEELVGTSFMSLLSEPDRSRCREYINGLSCVNPEGTFEHEVCAGDGSRRLLHWKDRIVCDDVGRVVGYQAVGQDVTAVRQAEERQAFLRQRLEAVWRASGMAEGGFAEVCDHVFNEARTITGSPYGFYGFLDKEETVMQPYLWSQEVLQNCRLNDSDRVFPLETAGVWADAVRSRKPLLLNDFGHRRASYPDGHVKIERLLVVPVVRSGRVASVFGVANKTAPYDEDDVRLLEGFLSSAEVVLEKLRVEETLRESEARYRQLSQEFRALLDGIPDIIVLLDREMRIVWGNQAACERFACAEDDISELFCNALCGCEGVPCKSCPVTTTLASNQNAESVIRHPDGTAWGVKAFPLQSGEASKPRVILVASDITEKLRLREEADRAGRLAAIGELAAGVAHEVNNPTGLILMNLPVVQEAFADALPILEEHARNEGDFFFGGLRFSKMKEQVPQLLSEMLDGADRIRSIVEDMKSFARGGSEDDFREIDLNHAADEAARLVRNRIRKATDHFSCELAADLPPVAGNLQRIEQVLVNLLLNACQALPDRSRGITVATRYNAQRRSCVLEVRDQGVGIEAADLPHLTDPFFTTRREQGGTGLGLSVSARIVREHGGRLSFESAVGQGTAVTVSFPVAASEEAS